MDDEVPMRFTDEEAREEIKKAVSGFEITSIKSMQKAQRDELLKKVKALDGVTQRQAARILGVSPNLIFKA